MSLPPRPPRHQTLGPGVRRVLAQNPSPMTYWGTNTYIVGAGEVAVIDPGPEDPAHASAILAALAPGEVVSHIFVTHAHLDHSPGARDLAARTGAPVLAYGDARAGRSARMDALAATGQLEGGEGVDADFAPDICLQDGAQVAHGGWRLEALWTPGHFGNHMAFAMPDLGALFCGDLVMGWASSLVSPPDGDLSAFLGSLDRLRARPEAVYYAGHGDPITDPQARIAELYAHRQMRSDQIRTALRHAPGSARTLAARIYVDTPKALLPAATRNVLAHLIDLEQKSEVTHAGQISAETKFSLNTE